MIIITITLSIVYAFILSWLAYTWYKDLKQKEDTDKRILVLEKRDAKKAKIKDVKELYGNFEKTTINLVNAINDIKERVGKIERKSKVSK